MGWQVQDHNDDAKVMVNGGYARDEVRTDFLIFDRETGEHTQFSISPEPGSNLIQHHDYR